MPLAIFVIRNSPASIGAEPDGGPIAPEAGTGQAAAQAESAQRELTVPQSVRTASFWYLFLVNFFMVLGTSIVTAHAVGIVADSSLGTALGREQAMWIGSRVITYFLVASIAGRYLGGVLAERLSKRHVMCVLYAVMILSALLLFRLNSMPMLYLFVILYGAGMGGAAVVYPLILGENFGLRSFSKLLGLMGIPFTLGAAIGQVGAARIYDLMKESGAANPYGGVFLTLVFVFAISTFLVLMAKPPKMPATVPAPAIEQEPA